jgi:FAD/FMN-containing dehydrogenase
MSGDGSREVLEAIVGPVHVLVKFGRLFVRPGSTEELSRCLAFLNSRSIPIVTIGGLTGLVGGTEFDGHAVGISTERLNKIISLDPTRRQMLVESGVTLHEIHRHAEEQGFRYGVDFGARGSCTIGGTIATNAGGTSVVRFGMTRANVLGLEAVLADGRVLSDLGALVKNNTGYDLKQLLIGSEGTLGIITKAVLKLEPRVSDVCTVLLAFDSLEAALQTLEVLKLKCGNMLIAVEIMWNRYFKAVANAVLAGSRSPISDHYPLYLLVEVEGLEPGKSTEMVLDAMENAEQVRDSALAESGAARDIFWKIRDGSEVIDRSHPHVLSFDVSMRPQDYADYVRDVEDALRLRLPSAVAYYFGHLADGNVHFMVGHDGSVPGSQDIIESCVYEPLAGYWPTSVSAEHGIGTEKRSHLWRSRTPVDIAVMNSIRIALDPRGTLNPQVQFEAQTEQAPVSDLSK